MMYYIRTNCDRKPLTIRQSRRRKSALHEVASRSHWTLFGCGSSLLGLDGFSMWKLFHRLRPAVAINHAAVDSVEHEFDCAAISSSFRADREEAAFFAVKAMVFGIISR